MKHSELSDQLARCIEEHNTLTRQARDLWVRAQSESRRIGDLVESAMSSGLSWTELGTLLSGIDDAPPPPGLAPRAPSSPAPSSQKSEGNVRAVARSNVPAQGALSTRSLDAGAVVPKDTPALLFQAYLAVAASTSQEMASRDLAVALGQNPNTIGPELCALLRAVGVERPAGGKIRARYAGNGKRLPGFTAACLQQGLDAYASKASAAVAGCP